MQNLNAARKIPVQRSGHSDPQETLAKYMAHMAETCIFIKSACYVPPRVDTDNVVKMVSP